MLRHISVVGLALALCAGAVVVKARQESVMQRAINAIKAGKVEDLEKALEESPGIISEKDETYGATLLHWAAAQKDLKTVTLLTGRGAPLEARNKEGATPLLVAIVPDPKLDKVNQEGLLEVVRSLATPEVVEMSNVDGRTALHLASQYNEVEVARVLITEKKANVRAFTNNCKTPLSYAVEANNQNLIKLLKEELAKVGAPGGAESSVFIHRAASAGRLVEVRCLVKKHRPWINSLNAYGETPLHVAARSKSFDVIAYLIKEGANLGLKDKRGRKFWDLICADADGEQPKDASP